MTESAGREWSPPPSFCRIDDGEIRTREQMPAHDVEVEEAEEEGVMMRWLSTIKQADEGKLVDNCFGACPDNAVLKLDDPDELYRIDLDFCKGCGICVAECPSGAIQMFPEQI